MKKTFIVLILLIISQNIFSQWTHIDPPVTLLSYQIDFVNDQVGFIYLENNEVWKTINGGHQWNKVIPNMPFNTFHFFTVDTGVAYIGTGYGKTYDGGITWHSVWNLPSNFDSDMNSSVFYFSKDNRMGYMVWCDNPPRFTDSAQCYRSMDYGDTWQLVSTIYNPNESAIIVVNFVDSLNGFLLMDSIMYKTTDAGVNWSHWHSFNSEIRDFYPISMDTVVAIDFYTPAIFKTVNGGQSWTTIPSPVTEFYSAIHFTSPDTGYICGGPGGPSGYVIKTIDGGSSWSLDFTDSHYYFCMSFPETHSIFIGGGDGAVIKYSEPIDTAKICYVSVDTNSLHNIIYWDKSQVTNVDSFIIYREITTNNYQRIGSVPYSDPDMFVDTVETLYFPNTGNPNSGTYRYKLQMLFSNGTYSVMSPYHNTIFIGNNSGTFIWPQLYTIEGSTTPVNSYILMRDDISDGNWHQVSSVSGTQQTITDPQYSLYQNSATWRVETQWNLFCSTSHPITVSISNRYRSTVGTAENNAEEFFHVHPNPASDELVVESRSNMSSINIFDILGKPVLATIDINNFKVEINISQFVSGVYIVRFESGGKIYYSRFVKQ